MKLKYLFSLLVISFLLTGSVSGDFSVLYNNALVRIQAEEYPDAVRLLKSALQLKKHSQAAFWLSYSHAQLGEKDSSLSYAKQALKYKPELNRDYRMRVDRIIEWGRQDTQRGGRFPASGPPYFEVEASDMIR